MKSACHSTAIVAGDVAQLGAPTATRLEASAVESLIELYAERLNRIGSQADADRLQVEIERAAKTLAPEELLAYAAAPSLRGQLLALCVAARAQQRAAAPHGSAPTPTTDHLTEIAGAPLA